MVFTTFSQALAFSTDFILILVSGSACIYCMVLNSRLKKLNDLETGVGASIVSLTTAIEDTYKAAQEAQESTQAAVENLQTMLKRSEIALPEYEIIVTNIETTLEKARDKQSELEYEVNESLQTAIVEAKSTAKTLLTAISGIYETSGVPKPREDEASEAVSASSKASKTTAKATRKPTRKSAPKSSKRSSAKPAAKSSKKSGVNPVSKPEITAH